LSVATDALGQTITYLTREGKFRQAADREKDIATICLQRSVEKPPDLQHDDLARACESYERAAKWYQQEDAVA
jgi:alpha-soluble NSF attachment protein